MELVFDTPYFHEALIKLDQPVDQVVTQLANAGIAGGYAPAAHYPQLANTLLVCATEMRTAQDIAHYSNALAAIMNKGGI